MTQKQFEKINLDESELDKLGELKARLKRAETIMDKVDLIRDYRYAPVIIKLIEKL